MTSPSMQEPASRTRLLDLFAPLYFVLMVILDPLPVGHMFANGLFAVLFLIFSFELLRGNITLRFGQITLLFTLTIIGHLIPVLIGTAVNL
ncbi:MAG: hypothetical protein KC518_01880, partial [Candidatus Cloacimonetes bacterium]|nr:hypothetical protein [Candidatus Cloacimonadota bacterium]